jgi:hypothetical protein
VTPVTTGSWYAAVQDPHMRDPPHDHVYVTLSTPVVAVNPHTDCQVGQSPELAAVSGLGCVPVVGPGIQDGSCGV